MKLSDLLTGTDIHELTGPPGSLAAEAEVSGVAYDSRAVRPGGLFVAIRGEKADGNRFVSEAIKRGARAVVSERARPLRGNRVVTIDAAAAADVPEHVVWVEVRNARQALATAASNFYGRPADALKLAGITGTNGKTTTAYLIDSMLRAAGKVSGLFGTIVHRTPRETRAAKNTTPESLELQQFLAEVRDAGGTHAALEVSSHALALDRVWGFAFAAAVFTNLTRDHLDFHKSFEGYFAAKRRLFEGTGAGSPGVAVVNTDDAYGRQLVGLSGRTLTYGLENGAEITTRKFSLGFTGLEFTAQTPEGKLEVQSPLVGRINVYNILAAIGAGLALGLEGEAMARGIRELRSVPGRFERVDEGQGFLVVVDYAHTDDALRNLIQTARELAGKGRVITLFGCGGDRDRTKRPLMGEAAGSLSDLVVLTSDNPRSEDPLLIINDAQVGLQRARAKYLVEPDRARAIRMALEEAKEADIVLLAGKGHETFQVLKDATISFSDQEEARAALRELGFAKAPSGAGVEE
jgi:UDP-N-acetylmuramoyl-L-alanyl-D-glutamate--2,6-diaminopimelate ligase